MKAELKNLTPCSFYDAMDLVEEHIGPDARQYIEAYFEDGCAGSFSDDQTEHHLQVLEKIELEVSMIESQLEKKKPYRKQVYEGTERIRNIISREERMFRK